MDSSGAHGSQRGAGASGRGERIGITDRAPWCSPRNNQRSQRQGATDTIVVIGGEIMQPPDCSLSLPMLANVKFARKSHGGVQPDCRYRDRYLPYDELERHKEAISRFGSGLKAIEAISRALP